MCVQANMRCTRPFSIFLHVMTPPPGPPKNFPHQSWKRALVDKETLPPKLTHINLIHQPSLAAVPALNLDREGGGSYQKVELQRPWRLACPCRFIFDASTRHATPALIVSAAGRRPHCAAGEWDDICSQHSALVCSLAIGRSRGCCADTGRYGIVINNR